MSAWKQTWLVARREMRERSRSRAFLASVVLTVVAVIALIVLPAALSSGGGTKHVGLTGTVPAGLPATIEAQGRAFGITVHTQRYDTLPAGEQAVRDKHIDVLVADAQQLEWPRTADIKLRGVCHTASHPGHQAPSGRHQRHPTRCGTEPCGGGRNLPSGPVCAAGAGAGQEH